MAEVVVEQGSQGAAQHSTGAFGELQGIFSWLQHYWWVILIVLLVVGAIIFLVYYLYFLDRERKRKDPMYVHFESTLEGCELNMRRDWIKKKRRWWFLWFGFFTSPLFGVCYLYLFLGQSWLIFFALLAAGFLLWMPLAWFFYKDQSMRVINVDKMTIGYYRGHCKRQDGYIYLLLCVGKQWVVMDDNLVVRLPQNVLTFKTIKKMNKKTGETEEKQVRDAIEIESYIWNERDNYIFLPMTTLVKEASYFYDPTFVQGKDIVDLRQKVANSYHLITQVQMAEQTYSQLGKVTNNAVDSNVGVKVEQKLPEKQRDVQSGEQGQ